MFNITELANDNVLVEGTDVRGNDGQQVLQASQWFERKRRQEVAQAHDEFDASVEAFFAPIAEAAAALEEAHKLQIDPLLYVVEQEAVEGRAPQAERLVQLDTASVILRAIEGGHTDRLIWVNGELTVTAKPVSAPAAPVVPAPPAEDTDPGVGTVDNPPSL